MGNEGSDNAAPGLNEAALAKALAGFPRVAAAYIFGSLARGEARADSDLDLGIVLPRGDTAERERDRLIGELVPLLETVAAPRPLDLVVLEEQGPVFCHEVLIEGRCVYEADRERRLDFESEVLSRAFDFRPSQEPAARGRLQGFRRWLDARRA